MAGFSYNRSGVGTLGHELVEWLMDPFFTSKSPGWVAANGSCVHHMEVGDPMKGTDYTVQVHSDGPTFELQDAAFESWFASTEPSTAIDGLRSFHNSGNPRTSCQ